VPHGPRGSEKGILFCVSDWVGCEFCGVLVANYFTPSPLSFPLSKWREPKDYVRPEEVDEDLEVRDEDEDMESESGSGSGSVEKGTFGDKGARLSD
jgi:NCS1 family nucleobase:cation symporter-1